MQLATLLTPDFSFRLLLTLAHFLWQGTAIAIVLYFIWPALRRVSARVRCHILTLSMLLMAAAPIVTFLVLAADDSPSFAAVPFSNVPPAPAIHSSNNPDETAASAPLPLITPIQPDRSSSSSTSPSLIAWRDRLRDLARPLVIVYLCGVILMLGRILLGLFASQRLCRDSHPVEPLILAALARQMKTLRLKLAPALAYCTKITTPVVVGLIRPTILLPLSLSSELSPIQIESILAHELAHIRRLDPALIILQRLIEAALFFHPAVWLISRQLDLQRERACDELVVKSGHNRLEYASALLQLAERALCNSNSPTQLAAAANPSHLRSRILALLGQPPRYTPRLTLRAGILVLAATIAFCLLLPRLGAQSRPAVPATAPTLLTKEQLLQRVTDLRSRVRDVSVSTTDVVVKGPPGVVQQSRRTIVLKRDMIYIDDIHGMGQNGPFRFQFSFDGRQTTQSGGPDGEAMISKGRSRQLDTQGIGFFIVNLLVPPGDGLNRSLLGALQKIPYTIRKDIELIDGHSCQVLEFTERFGEKMTVWLDLERGLLPIRHRSFRPDGKLWFECNIEKAVEVENGLWFATRAKTSTFPVFKDLPELGNGIDQVILVDPGRDGPLLTVNQDPDDSVFDLASRLPIGTKVFNIDDRNDWRVVGFTKEKKPATKPTAPAAPAQGPSTPLTVAPVITPDRKVEFDLKPWGEAVEGVQIRFRLSKGNGPWLPYIDIQNTGEQNLQYAAGRARLEFDQKWYARENERENLISLPPHRTYNAVGPISLGAQWNGEQDHQRLIKAPGKHTIRVKFVAQPPDRKGKPIEVITAPLIIELDAQGIPTTQPAQ